MTPIDFTNYENTMRRDTWGYIYALKIKMIITENIWSVIFFSIIQKKFAKFVGWGYDLFEQ